ncbi:hypothetical protein AA103196_0060 [Ameyamaea chiangmaiensis NBRC 103196]|nr:hypothetical protein AA103196_0060 [Ameyamaea chiangmaiensis NBRC 103196]
MNGREIVERAFDLGHHGFEKKDIHTACPCPACVLPDVRPQGSHIVSFHVPAKLAPKTRMLKRPATPFAIHACHIRVATIRHP